ncbi:MAG: CPBP family intramembrane metalloprotease [Planctomycetia bacterium]|nr:CPBP family intramembrane metalloprotease [Planctomycetia bacterium]
MMILNSYFKQSKSPFYSFIFILPLFVIYEFGISAISSKDLPTIRNGADVLLRKILATVGISGIYGMAMFLLIGIIITFLINKGEFRKLKFKGNYFIFMIFESILWSVILFIILSQGQLLLGKGTAKLLIQQIVLSIGSGIFEEFVFRVVLVSSFALIVGLFFKKQYFYKMSFAVIVAAVIFSLFHFIGDYADIPKTSLFILRFTAGIILGYIYILRGFGIAAYSHSFYNLIVFTQTIPDS